MFAALETLASLARRGLGSSGATALPLVHRLQEQLARETDAQLKERADTLRQEPQRRVPEAVALITESVRRSHGITAYDVQLLAGLALADGALVEMATGEGKTLVALLPAFVFGLQGRGAHVATVNPYLAGRDAEFARPVFERLGLTVGLLRERDAPSAKAAAYACDVTYGVGAEFGFDYLRDQIAIRSAGRVEPEYHEIFLGRLPEKPVLAQRGHAFAIIDEADSVLLDEARSPLIIAMGGKTPNATPDVYRLAAEVARRLREGEHYVRESSHARHTLTPEGGPRGLAGTHGNGDGTAAAFLVAVPGECTPRSAWPAAGCALHRGGWEGDDRG